MSDSHDASAVFSLELFVQHVEYFLDPVPRNAAVAFRLLDFPSVLIYAPAQSTPAPTDIFHAANFSENNVISFERGKSCLFTLGRDSLQKLLQKVPMYLMLVANPDANQKHDDTDVKLLGSTAVDMSQYATPDAIPTRDSTEGYQRGSFNLVDLMGNRVGKAHVIIRLSSFGLSLLPHLRVMNEGNELTKHTDRPPEVFQAPSHAATTATTQPSADSNKNALTAVEPVSPPKPEQSTSIVAQPPVASAAVIKADFAPTAVNTTVQHSATVFANVASSQRPDDWFNSNDDRPPALFFCKYEDSPSIVTASSADTMQPIVVPPLPSDGQENTEVASYLCWQHREIAPPPMPVVTAVVAHDAPLSVPFTTPHEPVANKPSITSNATSAASATVVPKLAVPAAAVAKVAAPLPVPSSKPVTPIKGLRTAPPKANNDIISAYGAPFMSRQPIASRPSSSAAPSKRPASGQKIATKPAKLPAKIAPSKNVVKEAVAWSIRDSSDISELRVAANDAVAGTHSVSASVEVVKPSNSKENVRTQNSQAKQAPNSNKTSNSTGKPSLSDTTINMTRALATLNPTQGGATSSDVVSNAIAGFFSQLTQLMSRVESSLPPQAGAAAAVPFGDHKADVPSMSTVVPSLQAPQAPVAAASVRDSTSIRRGVLDALANEIAFVRSSEYAQLVRKQRLHRLEQEHHLSARASKPAEFDANMFASMSSWTARSSKEGKAEQVHSSKRDDDGEYSDDFEADDDIRASRRKSTDKWSSTVRQWEHAAERAPQQTIAAALVHINQELQSQSGINSQLVTDFFRSSVQLQAALASSDGATESKKHGVSQSMLAKSLVNVASALHEARRSAVKLSSDVPIKQPANVIKSSTPHIDTASVSSAVVTTQPQPSAKSNMANSEKPSNDGSIATSTAVAASSASTMPVVKLAASSPPKPSDSNKLAAITATLTSAASISLDSTPATSTRSAVVSGTTVVPTASASTAVAVSSSLPTVTTASSTTTVSAAATESKPAVAKTVIVRKSNISMSSTDLSEISYSSLSDASSYGDQSFESDNDSKPTTARAPTGASIMAVATATAKLPSRNSMLSASALSSDSDVEV